MQGGTVIVSVWLISIFDSGIKVNSRMPVSGQADEVKGTSQARKHVQISMLSDVIRHKKSQY
jgi:hypothetical protein